MYLRYIAIMRHREKRNTAYTITDFNDIVKNSCCTNMSDTLTNASIHTQINTFCLIFTKIRSQFYLYCDTSTNRYHKEKQKKRLIKENKEKYIYYLLLLLYIYSIFLFIYIYTTNLCLYINEIVLISL